MLLDLNSRWFQAYCRAVMEDEPNIARAYIEDASMQIDKRLCAPDISQSEREALTVASHYLDLIRKVELPRAS
jgi:hypothetical protein